METLWEKKNRVISIAGRIEHRAGEFIHNWYGDEPDVCFEHGVTELTSWYIDFLDAFQDWKDALASKDTELGD